MPCCRLFRTGTFPTSYQKKYKWNATKTQNYYLDNSVSITCRWVNRVFWYISKYNSDVKSVLCSLASQGLRYLLVLCTWNVWRSEVGNSDIRLWLECRIKSWGEVEETGGPSSSLFSSRHTHDSNLLQIACTEVRFWCSCYIFYV